MKNERGWVFSFRMLLRQDLNFSNLTLETTIVTPLQFCFSDYMGAVGDSFCYLPVRLSSKTANRHFQKDCISSKTQTGYCHTKYSKSERGKQISHINTYMWNLKKKWYRWPYSHSRNRYRQMWEQREKGIGVGWTRRLELTIHYWYYV